MKGGACLLENNKEGSAEFERCVDFLVKMIELYGAEVLEEIEAIEDGNKNNIA